MGYYYWGDQVMEDKIGGACSMLERAEKRIQISNRKIWRHMRAFETPRLKLKDNNWMEWNLRTTIWGFEFVLERVRCQELLKTVMGIWVSVGNILTSWATITFFIPWSWLWVSTRMSEAYRLEKNVPGKHADHCTLEFTFQFILCSPALET